MMKNKILQDLKFRFVYGKLDKGIPNRILEEEIGQEKKLLHSSTNYPTLNLKILDILFLYFSSHLDAPTKIYI